MGSEFEIQDLGVADVIRALVCGGRAFTDRQALDQALDRLHAAHRITKLIHGGAEGGDSLAGDWAQRRGVPTTVFHADWQTHGRAAGPIRNERMLREGQPDLVIAFPGGHGTSQMVRLARRNDVVVWKPIDFEELPPKKWERRELSEARGGFVTPVKETGHS